LALAACSSATESATGSSHDGGTQGSGTPDAGAGGAGGSSGSGGSGGGLSDGGPGTGTGGTSTGTGGTSTGTGACGGPSTALDGTPDPSHPSGMAPPTCVPQGYSVAYIDDFPGTSLAHGWFRPGPEAYKASYVSPQQVGVHDGMMDITMTYSGKSGDSPLVGWVQLSNEPAAVLTYGKYLIRERADVFNDVWIATLTWPNPPNGWPPEIDFAEDDVGNRHFWSHNHYDDANNHHQYTSNDSSVTSADWHTWGLEWTPTSVTYTRDGAAWKTETDPQMIPKIKMYLGFVMSCPVKPAAGTAHWQVDWVAVYSHN
jgi:hypothetical protein